MYLDRYSLKAPPFGSVPDADFYFLSDRHVEARQHIDQALWHDECLVAIVGEKGIGKSALSHQLLDELQNKTSLITLDRCPSNELDFMSSLLKAFGFENLTAEREEYRNIISAYLLHQQRQGSRPVLVLDDAERLPIAVLQEIYWLAAVANEGRAALHFVLFGRGEFQEKLLQRELRDLGDRIRIRHQLKGLGEEESAAYISHRLNLVGGDSQVLFPDEIMPVIYRYTSGVPGRINELCHTALLKAASDKRDCVDAGSLKAVIEMLRLKPAVLSIAGRSSANLGAFRREDVAKFVITDRGQLSASVRLDKKRLVIGRHNLNDITLDSNAVSRSHAQVIATEGVYVLIDINSTNGTFVNFKRVQQHVLRDNDIIGIGKHRLKFVAARANAENIPVLPNLPLPSETVVLDAGQLTPVKPAIKSVK